MTASYVVTHGGKLPSHHYLPCFVKNDDFERINKAQEWLDEMVKRFGTK